MVPVRALARGRWVPSADLRRTLCLIVIDGLVLRSIERDGLEYLVLYGPGDLVDLHPRGQHETWTVRRAATLAAFDGHVVARSRELPPLLVALLRRMLAGQREQEMMVAIARMTRVNDRLLALMRHLAGRWGRVTTAGHVLVMPLTHAELGSLIGARRPTVTIAVSQLADAGLLTRTEGGEWVVQMAPDGQADGHADGNGAVRLAKR
jgi:CRP-like cAMP-binding protein